MKHVDIYTDGACSGNPGPGGWGAVLRYGEVEKELSGGEAETTNNRMELLAAISALEALKGASRVDLHTDSKYVQDGIHKWIHGWKKNGWKTAAKTPVKNVELWQRLDAARQRHEVRWHWVKGHAGHDENERADELAREGIKGWLEGWKRNGWKTADKKPVKNIELWQALDEARRIHKVTWHWVKGHAGHVENERADELARMGMAPFKPGKPSK